MRSNPTLTERRADEEEIQEWLESLNCVLTSGGPVRVAELMTRLLEHVRGSGLSISSCLNTPYRNTIPCSLEGTYPGDLKLERRISGLIRWNAIAMVVRANKNGSDLGGHLSSFASAADLFEVGFNHFFRASGTHPQQPGDLVFFQAHSAPGLYARAFLEGRLEAERLACYRREVGGKGLSSYPHPWLMPDFWQFPTASMGLGPLTAVYQARFIRYLENRGLAQRTDRKVWAFVGDGEMDEPESLAGLSLAAREGLDNLIFVVNCNLQRLDGPVRGNSSIVQELERTFLGAGWNIIKVLWGSDWDSLFLRDKENLILSRLREVVDGELQSYGAHDASFNRERFFSKYEELRDLASGLTDNQIDALTRGGHDPIKIYAAFRAATQHAGQPTVILAQTKKGYGLGRWAESRMSAHQQKKLDKEALRLFRDRFELPLSNEDVDEIAFYRPSPDTPEMCYLRDCRDRLGGYLPSRRTTTSKVRPPRCDTFAQFAFTTEERATSTTVAFTRMLTRLLKDVDLGPRIVPVVADEARTFGMESLFRSFGIYSHCGQLYEPADQDDLLYYRESRDGQILQEGINEAGALSSWLAAATAYSHHEIPMLPFYIYYSIFGFQRVHDLIWAAADSRARGFLMGATAGRTTLSGEGLQHQDGSSHLLASTVPSCRAYDPCFAYELALILEHGMSDMLDRQEDVFYYVTLMNESYIHPPMPPGAEKGIVSGMYLVRESSLVGGTLNSASRQKQRVQVQLLGSGTILREALVAAELLERDWKIAVNVWSVTSFTELRRNGLEVERSNRMRSPGEPRASWVEQCLGATTGPVVAATDYVRAVPDLIRTWIPRRYITLGTDGFGRSDTSGIAGVLRN